MLNGIDISMHQRGLDLSKVKSDFVIMKATEGIGYKDPCFDSFYKQAEKLGKKLGVYHFARPTAENDPVKEAQWFYSQVKHCVGKAILILDWEAENMHNVAWAKKWLDEVYKLTKVRPMFYTYESCLLRYDWSPLAKASYGLWVAKYRDNVIDYNYNMSRAGTRPTVKWWQFYAMWQWTSSGRLSGWGGNLDCNIFYGDGRAWDAYAGTVKKTKAPAKTTTKAPAKTNKSYAAFRNKYLGKRVDIDGWYGAQCWDLVSGAYFPYIGGKIINCPLTGYVIDIYTNRTTNGILTFCNQVPLTEFLRPGDVCIWARGAGSACPSSHIAIYDHDEGQNAVFFFGQNQGGYGCTIQQISVRGIVGVFRPKIFM